MHKFTMLHPKATLETLGFLPMFLDDNDPRPASKQFNSAYVHGGGWSPFKGFKFDQATKAIQYPGDPRMLPIAVSILHGIEHIFVYPHSWVLILQEDGSFEISRMD